MTTPKDTVETTEVPSSHLTPVDRKKLETVFLGGVKSRLDENTGNKMTVEVCTGLYHTMYALLHATLDHVVPVTDTKEKDSGDV